MKSEETIKAVSYIRVATYCSRKNPAVNFQKQLIKDYLEHHPEIIHCRTYLDLGVSGITPFKERPQGSKLLKDVIDGKFGVVLVTRIDRLGRSLKQMTNAVDTLMDLGISIRSISEPYDTETPEGRLIFNMMANFAEFDLKNRKLIKERI